MDDPPLPNGETETAPRSGVPLSAASWAEQLGDTIPYVEDIPAESLELVRRVRELTRLVVLTDVSPEERARATALVADACDVLAGATREQTVVLMRHRDGRIDNVTQAGSGCLNPQAPDIRFIDVPPDPQPGQQSGTPTDSSEIVGEVMLTAAHVGPPSGAHGGIVATVLDQALGIAARAAGVSGMTASLTISYRRPTPIDVMLRVAARVTQVDGRKSYAAGEISVDGRVVADATALFIREALP